MKKTLTVVILAAAASSAVAQSLPSSEELAAQFYTETGQLRVLLGQAQMQVNAQKKRIAELEEKLKAADAKAASATSEK